MATVEEHFAAAVVEHQGGNLDAAEQLYRQILAVSPAHSGSLSNLGVILARQGRFDEAARYYNAALAKNPDQLDAHYNLGNLYRRQGRNPDAVAAYHAALAIDPHHPRVMLNLGLALRDLGDGAAAVGLFRQAIHRDPGFAEAYNLLGDLLARQGSLTEAIEVFREFVARTPDDPRGRHNLGLALAARGDADEALPELERALRLRDEYPEAHNSLAVTLDGVGRVDEALAHYRRATALRPDFADAWSNLGTSLCEQGRTTEAVDASRRSLALRPEPRVHSNLLLATTYSSAYTPEQLLEEHKGWAAAYAAAPPPAAPAPRDPDPERRLRIGYVSGDFRKHTLVGFVESLLTGHDRNRVHVTCYSNVNRPDDTTDRMRRLADVWRPIHRVSDGEAARLIGEDEIDVLIDLAGHTAGNRLPLFARRPAPVQVTLFGYPATTGLPAIGYRVSDPYADPPGETEAFYTETVARLPECAWVYRTPASSPDVFPLPALKKRVFTFGCLNNPAKLSDACVEAWAKILKAVPKSRLVLMTGRSAEAAQAFTKRFGKLGVSSDRVEAVMRLAENQYLEGYQPIDLASTRSRTTAA